MAVGIPEFERETKPKDVVGTSTKTMEAFTGSLSYEDHFHLFLNKKTGQGKRESRKNIL